MRPVTGFLLLAILCPGLSQAAVVLGFERINLTYPSAAYADIQNFYNGGTSSQGTSGTNFGISFGPDAQAVCLNGLGGSCSNASAGGLSATSSQGALGLGPGGMTYLDIPAGFTFAIGFRYAIAPSGPPAFMQAFSGLAGTGAALSAPLLLVPNALGCPAYNAMLCPLGPGGLSFAGTARSVVFWGAPGTVVWDDLTFGFNDPQSPPGVPAPATLALLVTALCWLRRPGSLAAHRSR